MVRHEHGFGSHDGAQSPDLRGYIHVRPKVMHAFRLRNLKPNAGLLLVRRII